jgi:hypothetical protein
VVNGVFPSLNRPLYVVGCGNLARPGDLRECPRGEVLRVRGSEWSDRFFLRGGPSNILAYGSGVPLRLLRPPFRTGYTRASAESDGVAVAVCDDRMDFHGPGSSRRRWPPRVPPLRSPSRDPRASRRSSRPRRYLLAKRRVSRGRSTRTGLPWSRRGTARLHGLQISSACPAVRGECGHRGGLHHPSPHFSGRMVV